MLKGAWKVEQGRKSRFAWREHSRTHAPHPGSDSSLQWLCWFQLVVFPTHPEPVSESLAHTRWSPLQGLVPPLSLKLWKFQSLLFIFPPACYEELLPAIYYNTCIPFLPFQISNIWLTILGIKSCLILFLSPDQFRSSCQEWCQKQTPKSGVQGWLGS